ncbi:acyltransferase [Neobacillus sp. SAB-20_R2A]|uniref:acyltransferase n=1 Tax=Neobacillus sp. SAB-20_R2A TaxID=3120519 RepID=UPI003C6E6ABB
MRNQIYYFDWLRVFATIAVVTIHVTANYVSTIQSGQEFTWVLGNFFETISRWSVPGFVMISGALLLKDEKEIPYWDFLKRRLSKVAIPFVGWSVIFYIYGVYKWYFPNSIKEGIKLFLNNGIAGHFWFFYMIIGLYLITPLLKVFIKNAEKRHLQYFLILWLYASFFTKMSNFLWGMQFSLELFFVTDYIGYFVLGYYLNQYDISKRWRKISYIGLFVGFILTFFLTYFYTINAGGKLNQFWYEYFSPNVLLCAVGLFVFFRYNFNDRKLPLLLSGINQASLGVYIFHYWLLNNYLWKVFPYVEQFHSIIIEIPLKILITLIFSTIITLVLKRIPLVNKLVP